MQIAKVQNNMNFKGLYLGVHDRNEVYALKDYIKSDETLAAFENTIGRINTTADRMGFTVPLHLFTDENDEPVIRITDAGEFSLADVNMPESKKVKELNEFANSVCARMQYNKAKGGNAVDKILRDLGTH